MELKLPPPITTSSQLLHTKNTCHHMFALASCVKSFVISNYQFLSVWPNFQMVHILSITFVTKIVYHFTHLKKLKEANFIFHMCIGYNVFIKSTDNSHSVNIAISWIIYHLYRTINPWELQHFLINCFCVLLNWF